MLTQNQDLLTLFPEQPHHYSILAFLIGLKKVNLFPMPTVLLLNGFRFFFYSNENDEPAHIHVRKGDGESKVWLEPELEIAWTNGFSQREQNEIWDIAVEHHEFFKLKWNEYFSK
jgi:hypothetical protein